MEPLSAEARSSVGASHRLRQRLESSRARRCPKAHDRRAQFRRVDASTWWDVVEVAGEHGRLAAVRVRSQHDTLADARHEEREPLSGDDAIII